MAEVDPVKLQLFVDDRQYMRTLSNVQSVTEQRLSAMEGKVVSVTGTFERSFAAARTAMLSLLAGVSVVAFAKTLATIGDEAKGLEAQLRLATQGFGTFSQAQEDSRRIADATRSGISDTVKLYSNFLRASKEMGATQIEAARATETFSKSLKISGADANQAASATLQFGQALASGALRGDELNSILEASPRLARLLAESMGKPIGEIKKLGEEGRLTSDRLLAALTDKKFTDGIDREFQMIPLTVDDAMTKVRNASFEVFSAFDRGGEFSTMLANFIADGADGFDDLVESAEAAGVEIRAIMEGLSGAFDPVKSAGADLFEFLIGQSQGWGDVFRNEIRNTLAELDFLSGAFANAQNLWIDFANGWDGLINRVHGTNRSMRERAGPSDLVGRFDQGYNDRRQKAEMDRLKRERERAEEAPPVERPRRPTETAKASKTRKAPKSPLDAEAFAREEAQLNSQILRMKADEVEDAAERARLESERIEAQRQYAVESVNADKRYTDEQKRKIIALTDVVAALEQSKIAQEAQAKLDKAALEAQQNSDRYAYDALQASADIATTRKDSLAAEERILSFLEQREQAELEALIAAGKIADAIQARADLEAAQTARRTRAAQDHASPLERRRREVADTAADMTDAIENIELDAIDRLTDGLADASTEFIKLGGIAGDVLNGIIRDMIRLAAQQAIFGGAGGGGVLGAIGGIFGIGGGNFGAAAASMNANSLASLTNRFGGARAKGGPVRAGQTYLVGEEGPELFTAQSSGTIVPNHMLDTSAARAMTGVSAVSPASAMNGSIRVAITMDNDVFTARVQEASVPVAVEVVRLKSPGLIQAAKAETVQALSRPRL